MSFKTSPLTMELPMMIDKPPYVSLSLVIGTVVLTVLLPSLMSILKQPPLPSINYRSTELTYRAAKAKSIANAKKLISAGLHKFGGPFSLVTDHGPKVILPPSYVDFINHEDRAGHLGFMEVTRQETFGHIPGYGTVPGFEPFNPPPGHIVEDTVRMKLTQNLPKFTKVLSDEMNAVLPDTWTDSKDWHSAHLRTGVLAIVARISARVFAGPELCRNPDWLRVSIGFTVDSFEGARELRLWPAALRPFAHWFLPGCRKARQHIKEARELLGPVLAKRREAKTSAIQEGTPFDGEPNTMDWLEETAKGRPYDPAISQVGLALAAIHTTSDLLSQAIVNLCIHPEIVPQLRKEAIDVLTQHGWAKTSMYQMRLMDSFLKETQRLKPVSMITMNRLAIQDLKLPDGTTIPKGTSLALSSQRMWDPAVYPEPEKFDAHRFVKMRETPGQENKAHLVSTSAEHTGFSHGKHACPGRFFAANEAKIALAHIVLKYDLRLAEGTSADFVTMGTAMLANPRAMIEVRRRDEEFEL